MSVIRTGILDGHYLVAQGIVEMLNNHNELDLAVAEIFTSAKELWRFLRIEELDLLIMEIALPDEDGLKMIPELRNSNKMMKILVLSSYSDTRFVKKALQTGADGFVAKTNTFDDLLVGISDVVKDRTYIAEGLHITPPRGKARTDNNHNGIPGSYKDKFLIQKRLTKREQEILHLITQAKNNKEIATELYISDQTVGVHRKNIMRKLGVRNTVNLIKFAIEYQLV